jgi:hypothetical protein
MSVHDAAALELLLTERNLLFLSDLSSRFPELDFRFPELDIVVVVKDALAAAGGTQDMIR